MGTVSLPIQELLFCKCYMCSTCVYIVVFCMFIVRFLFDFCAYCVIISSMTVYSSVPYFSSLHRYYGLQLTASSFPSEEYPSLTLIVYCGVKEGMWLTLGRKREENILLVGTGGSPMKVQPNQGQGEYGLRVLVSSHCEERAAFPFLPDLEWWECKHELRADIWPHQGKACLWRCQTQRRDGAIIVCESLSPDVPDLRRISVLSALWPVSVTFY